MQNQFIHLSAESDLSRSAQVQIRETIDQAISFADQIAPIAASMSGDARAIVAFLKEHKGQNMGATWQRPLKTLKTAGNAQVVKRVSTIIRSGIDFSNIASVQHEREQSGTTFLSHPLPWGQWAEFPFIISHKGKEYLRLYPASLKNLPMQIEYFLNGFPATKEQVKPLCLASEFQEKDRPECFTIKAESLVALG